MSGGENLEGKVSQESWVTAVQKSRNLVETKGNVKSEKLGHERAVLLDGQEALKGALAAPFLNSHPSWYHHRLCYLFHTIIHYLLNQYLLKRVMLTVVVTVIMARAAKFP